MESLLKSQTVDQVRKSSLFMEPELATGSYSETDESSPHRHTLSLYCKHIPIPNMLQSDIILAIKIIPKLMMTQCRPTQGL